MVYKIDLQGSTAITLTNKVEKICAPLQNLNISGFQYMRRFPDGSRYILCNCPELMRYFYEECFYPHTWYDNEKPIAIYRSGIEFWPINSLYNTTEQESLAVSMRELFNITQSITFLEKHRKYLEVIRFFSNDISIYLLNVRILSHFIFYFYENMQRYLINSRDESFMVPVKKENPIILEKKEKSFLELIPIKKYYLKGEFDQIYLTHSEKNCLHWCVQGKSYEETATILGISRKTVENNIQKIKDKLNFRKQSQLVTFAINQGICHNHRA